MNHAPLRLAAALALASAAPFSLAQTVVNLSGTSDDGLAVTGTIGAKFSSTANLQETLADGTLHNRFTLTPDGVFNIVGGWRIEVGTQQLFAATEDAYEHGVQTGPQVDSYLTPDGHSALSFDWTIYPECHGGCTLQDTLHLDLISNTGSLFGTQIDSAVFGRYTSGSGTVSELAQYAGPGEPGATLTQSHFTLSAVPEPGVGLLSLFGVAGALLATRRGQPRALA